jgi:lysophospholipase L1-like esterase
MRMTREAAGRLALLAGSVLAALVLGEGAVRFYESALQCGYVLPDPPGMVTRVPRYDQLLTPGYRGTLGDGCWETTVVVSQEGVRRSGSGEAGRGARRILFVGDSYVFGYGVEAEEAIPARLERRLAERTRAGSGRAPVEVVNGGVPGWTTLQEALFVEERAEALGADEVLLLLYLGNDVEERAKLDDRARSREAAAPGSAQERAGAEAAARGLPSAGRPSWLRPGSRLANLIRLRRREAAHRLGITPRPIPEGWFEMFRVAERDRVARALALMREDLGRLARLCAAKGIRLGAVVAPAAAQVTHPTSDRLCREFDCRAEEMDMRKPNRDVAALLDAEGIPRLDLTDAMERAYREGGWRLTAGGHWDARACDLAARVIADWLPAEPRAAR